MPGPRARLLGGDQAICTRERGMRSHVDQLNYAQLSVSACMNESKASSVVGMYVARVPNRGSPPAVLLRESYREAGKVKNRTLANLSRWPGWQVDALAAVLKGVPLAAGAPGPFEITRSPPHG